MAADSDWVDVPLNSKEDDGWVDVPLEPVESKPPEISQGETALRSGLEGATGGFSGEITGSIQSQGDLLDPVLDKLGISNPTAKALFKTLAAPAAPVTLGVRSAMQGGLPQDYKEERDIEQNLINQAATANPKTAFAAELGGAIASPLNKLIPAGSAKTVLGATAKGLGIGAGTGGLYGLGKSEGETASDVLADTAKGATIGALTGGVAGGGAKLIGKGLEKTGEVLGRFKEPFKKAATELGEASEPSKSGTGRVVNAIEKKIAKLERDQAKPEAAILKELSSDVGTKEGVYKRQSALMSDLTRQEKNEQFFNRTKGTLKSIEDNFKDFEKNIRFQEAAENLKKVNPKPAKEAARAIAREASGAVQDMTKEGEELLFDQGRVKFIDKYMRDLSENIEKAPNTLEVYKVVNDAKKQIATLAKYGKNPNPNEKATIAAVQKIENDLSSMLENPQIFGKQAGRHASINEAYNKYITSLQNMQKRFAIDELTEAGRKSKELSSWRVGTYSTQLNKLYGADRRRALDSWIENAKKLSGQVGESSQTLGKSNREVDALLADYLKAKDQFTKEMTLSNQLRSLRTEAGAENLANMGGVIQGAAEGIAKKYVPFADTIKGAVTSGAKSTDRTNALLQELLKKEQGQGPFQRIGARAGAYTSNKISEALAAQPQIFGRFSKTLQEAASRGPQAVSAINHVLQQQDPEYRDIARKLNEQQSNQ